MAEPRLIRPVLVAATAIAITVSAVGCGVSANGPTRIGNAIAAGPNPRDFDPPPGPDDAQLPADLVEDYFAAAVESGSNSALQRLGAFLTTQAAAVLNSSVDPKNPAYP